MGLTLVTNTPLWWGAVDDGGGYALVGAGGIWELSVPSFQFGCEPKTALKNKIKLKKHDQQKKINEYE